MSKLGDFFLGFKKRYDAQVVRNQKMDEFLSQDQKRGAQIDAISDTVSQLVAKVDNVQADVKHLKGQMEIVGKGTKMELFDTLYNWKKILVDDRGWASEAEKREVKEIYEVYHDGLKGNGEGKFYFEQIIKLPETPPVK